MAITRQLAVVAKLAYERNSEDVRRKLNEHPLFPDGFMLLNFDESPIGCLAIRSPIRSFRYKCDEYEQALMIGFRGTNPALNPSSVLVDSAIALGSPARYSASTASDAIGDYTGIFLDPTLINGILTLISRTIGETGYDPYRASHEVLQAFVFRAFMFTQHHINKFSDKKTLVLLTGHSLGGMYAQIIGDAMGIDAVTFNAPGSLALKGPCIKGLEMYPIYKQTKKCLCSVLNLTLGTDAIGRYGEHLGKRRDLSYDAKYDPGYIEEVETAKATIVCNILKEVKEYLTKKFQEYEEKSSGWNQKKLDKYMLRVKVAEEDYERMKRNYPDTTWLLFPQESSQAKTARESLEKYQKSYDELKTAEYNHQQKKAVVNVWDSIRSLGEHPRFTDLEEGLLKHHSILGDFFSKMSRDLQKRKRRIHFLRQHSMDAILATLESERGRKSLEECLEKEISEGFEKIATLLIGTFF